MAINSVIDALVRRVIVATRPEDSGVAVTVPSNDCIAELTSGGRPWLGPRRDWEIEKFVRGGLPEQKAARWIDAVIAGNATTAEAYGLIRMKDVAPDALAVELIEIGELPPTRWARNAWRRSANGGPIYIDLARAITIERDRCAKVYRAQMAAAEAAQELAAIFGAGPVSQLERLKALDIRAALMRMLDARSEAELRAMWPAELRGETA